MRNLMVAIGVSSIAVLAFAACGSDVETQSSQSTSSSASTSGGGNGGNMTSSSSTGSSTGGGGMGSGGNSTGSLCDQACEKIAVECGAGPVCQMPPVSNVLNCADPNSECPGQCILDADCGAIFSIVGNNPDPALVGCLQGCQGGQGGGGGGAGDCQGCLFSSCGAEAGACSQNTTCADFASCAMACGNGDGACYTGCANANPSAETTALVNCATNSCSAECGLGAGTGGTGGGGGSGGAGGN